MKIAILLLALAMLAACSTYQEPTQQAEKHCGKWIVTCIYNAGYGKNVMVADSIETYNKKYAVIFVGKERIELSCDEIELEKFNCR